jgi:periplasmic protein TonB
LAVVLKQSNTKDSEFSVLAIAILVSIFAHVVLLAIHFEPEIKKFANKLPSLDVVLVNAKTKTAPEKADLLAQANLDRGGNTDKKNAKMKTALPAPLQKNTEVKMQPSAASHSAAKAAKLQAQEAREQKRIQDLEKQAQELFTQMKSTKSVESKPTQDAASAEPEKGEQKAISKLPDRSELIAASVKIEQLQAQIDKQQKDIQERPKRRFIGGRAMATNDAMYLDSWRRKVEKIGNENYPQEAKDKKVYGQLRMTLSIKADGTIESMEINKSSGSKILDEAAKSIVRRAAPFSKFEGEMKRTTDILSITRTWTFTQEDALATE